MPFLTNSKELDAGDLLVLPFDGGMAEIHCESFPKNADDDKPTPKPAPNTMEPTPAPKAKAPTLAPIS